MKSYTVSSNSWHYRLATFWVSSFADKRNITLCTYLWRMLWGSFILVFMLVLVLSFVIEIAGSLFYELRWLLQILIQHKHIPFPQQGIVAIGLTLGFFIYGASELFFYLNSQTDTEEPVQESLKNPSFLRQAYDSWKNKHCVRIHVE